ncbi:MAG TPA: cytochrome c peroxidase [Polyangiaceae bacterium]|nr:cytochrome c peroxidase [Polyangiaceae bacterium]
MVDLSPVDNALTEPRAQLGKRLFYDTRLSRDGSVACSSCHRQEHAFAEDKSISIGVDERRGTRNAPALVNLAWGASFFWDGSVRTLEEQVGKPIAHPDEMGLSLAAAVARVAADESYVTAFVEAYAEPPSDETLRKALASFLRTLVSGNSAYDRHLRGDGSQLGEPERRGEALFLGGAGCFHCHPAGMLTDEGFRNNGTFTPGGDAGRQLFTGRAGDLGKFKVPGLRNEERSAPYMHDGSLPTLEAVVEHYDRGGLGDLTTDPQLEPLALSPREKADLVAFLRSLTDPEFLSDPRFRP